MRAHRIGPATAEELRSLAVVWDDPAWSFGDIEMSLRRPRAWIKRFARILNLPPRARQHARHYVEASVSEIVMWARANAPDARTFVAVNQARLEKGLPMFQPIKEKSA